MKRKHCQWTDTFRIFRSFLGAVFGGLKEGTHKNSKNSVILENNFSVPQQPKWWQAVFSWVVDWMENTSASFIPLFWSLCGSWHSFWSDLRPKLSLGAQCLIPYFVAQWRPWTRSRGQFIQVISPASSIEQPAANMSSQTQIENKGCNIDDDELPSIV